MDAYVDLSYMFHVLILFTLPYYYKRILNKKMKIIEIIALIVFSLSLYISVFIFPEYKYLNYLSLFLYYLLIYHKDSVKYYLTHLFVYYSNIAICSIFTYDIYLLNGIVFLNNPSAFIYILIELVNIIFIEIIFLSIRSIKLFKNYRMKISVYIEDKLTDFTGYLDSGNTLMIDSVPVIFLKEEYFKNKEYKEMMVSGIGKSKSKYFFTKVVINEKEKNVICASSKSGFKGCDCLININLMEGHENEITK